MRHVLTVEQIAKLANSKMDIDAFEKNLYENDEYRHSLAKKYAMKHKLHNGATLEFPQHGYRNHNLLFWDAQNKEIVETFSEMDDYGSVPPRFVVGDGYFNPNDWLDEVEHNSFVFPARVLINEMKAFALEHPDKKKMIVTINGNDYTVRYNPVEMKDKWDSCVLEVDPFETNKISVYPGDPKWRETIIDDLAAPEPVAVPAPDAVAAAELDTLKKANEDLTKRVEELTTMVQQLIARV
jgi:hypothetical protein